MALRQTFQRGKSALPRTKAWKAFCSWEKKKFSGAPLERTYYAGRGCLGINWEGCRGQWGGGVGDRNNLVRKYVKGGGEPTPTRSARLSLTGVGLGGLP